MERTWLIRLRKANGLTCKEFGAKIGISESYYWNLEQGLRASRGLSVETVCKIAEATGAKVNELLNAEIAWGREANV